VRLQQRETLAVVESLIEGKDIDLGVKAVETPRNSAIILLAVRRLEDSGTASV
jgi:hypothetical protein